MRRLRFALGTVWMLARLVPYAIVFVILLLWEMIFPPDQPWAGTQNWWDK